MKKYALIGILCMIQIRVMAQNQNISNGTVFEGEPFIAVNPVNPENLVVCWMGFDFGNGSGLTIKLRSTFDGGSSWTPVVMMPHQVQSHTSADPSMAFDENGKLFISYIDYRKNPDSGGVYICRSLDGGLTWSIPVKAIDAYDDGAKIPVDRPWLSLDGHGNHLFLTTKPAPWIPAPNRPYFLSSSDSGQSWGAWRYLDSTGYLVGNLIVAPMASPAVSSNGCVYAAYPSFLPSQGLVPRFILAKSCDGGTGFSYYPMLNITTPAVNDSAKLAYLLLADPADSNHLVFIFPDANAGDIDISMIESTDAGVTWSQPTRVNDDQPGNSVMQDMLWAAFDADGDLLITWRDRRNAAGTGYPVASDYYAAFRDNDSLNFFPNFRLSDSLVAFHPILVQDGNDFMSSVVRNDTVSAVWANTRDGSLDVWFSRLDARTGNSTGVLQLAGETVTIGAYPNPSSESFTIVSAKPVGRYRMLDPGGKTILTGQTEDQFIKIDLTGYPGGLYLLESISGIQKSVMKLMLK